jgi:hypothetical protein
MVRPLPERVEDWIERRCHRHAVPIMRASSLRQPQWAHHFLLQSKTLTQTLAD